MRHATGTLLTAALSALLLVSPAGAEVRVFGYTDVAGPGPTRNAGSIIATGGPQND